MASKTHPWGGFFFGYNPMAYHKRLAGFFIAPPPKKKTNLVYSFMFLYTNFWLFVDHVF